MRTIQVVIEEELLVEADAEVRRSETNRSALIRAALREHLKRLRIAAWEEQERQAYRDHPLASDDIEVWQEVQVWPED